MGKAQTDFAKATISGVGIEKYNEMRMAAIQERELEKQQLLDAGFRAITRHFYEVRNQNGFNSALYHFYEATDDGAKCSYTKQAVRKAVQNFPLNYPTHFFIINQMFECSRIFIEEIDVDDVAHSQAFFHGQ